MNSLKIESNIIMIFSELFKINTPMYDETVTLWGDLVPGWPSMDLSFYKEELKVLWQK